MNYRVGWTSVLRWSAGGEVSPQADVGTLLPSGRSHPVEDRAFELPTSPDPASLGEVNTVP